MVVISERCQISYVFMTTMTLYALYIYIFKIYSGFFRDELVKIFDEMLFYCMSQYFSWSICLLIMPIYYVIVCGQFI